MSDNAPDDIAFKMPDSDSRYLELAAFAACYLDCLERFTDPIATEESAYDAYQELRVVMTALNQLTTELTPQRNEK